MRYKRFLPADYSAKTKIEIYTKRIGIVLIVALSNFVLLGLWILFDSVLLLWVGTVLLLIGVVTVSLMLSPSRGIRVSTIENTIENIHPNQIAYFVIMSFMSVGYVIIYISTQPEILPVTDSSSSVAILIPSPTQPPPTQPTPTQPPQNEDAGNPSVSNPEPFEVPEINPRSETTYTETSYIVKAGDNLYRIGFMFGISWVQIAEANGLANPNRINAGDVLKIPASALDPSSQVTHQVKLGDTLFKISLQYEVTWIAIATENDIKSPYVIYVGQSLRIPGK